MITIETRSYELPSRTELAFFKDENHFKLKVCDHFLNPAEPWSRLLGVKFLRRVRQKLAAGEVSVLEQVYADAIPVLDEGVQFAVDLPLFVRFEAEFSFGGGRNSTHEGWYMLAKAGFKVVAHGGIVRTAYFVSKTPGDSYFTLFKEAWRSIKARALTKQYTDHKGGRTVRHKQVEWFNTDNWTRCPNPHKKPPSSARKKALPPEIERWLEDVDQDIPGN